MSAISNNIPVWILVDAQVYAEYQTFQKNKKITSITYAHVDSVNIFLLIEEILLQRQNNALFTFNRYTDIEDWLREQWAGIFRDLLKRTAQSQQLASLSTQVLQLSEINKTLKTYLESLMRSVSPEQYEHVIETESSRLSEIEKLAGLRDNSVFRHFDNYGIDFDSARDIIEKSKNFEEFKTRVRKLKDGKISDHAYEVFERVPAAQRDLNNCREMLGKHRRMPPKLTVLVAAA